MLLIVSFIFDFLGFVVFILLEGKKMLLELCKENIGWEDRVLVELKVKWERWRLNLFLL